MLSLSDAPLLFLFDANKLEKIFSNLLSNAFKFTPDGGQISLHVALVPDSSWLTRSVVQVTLQDNGLGIAVEQLDKIFDRFYQGNNHHYSDQQGTGIGLALVKELVQLHQGKVWAEANNHQGTCFVIQLPLEPVTMVITEEPVQINNTIELAIDGVRVLPDNPTKVQPEVLEPEVNTKTSLTLPKHDQPLVLIVEDNADLRQYLRQHLQASYRVLESENGKQGLEMAIAQVPDLIISDLMMPEMDGLELCSQIKTNEFTSHIPFILLTALATSESKLEGLENGADDYLIKPFHAQELQIRVRNLIETRKKLRARFGKEIRLQPKDIAVTSMDEKFLDKALQIVENNLGNPDFGAEEFSRELGMSRMQLHRKLTALTNQNTSDFLRTLRLKRAAQLLTSKAGNVSEIAYQVGFNSLPYFSKCFREQFGVTANQYLAQLEPQPEE